MNLPKPKTQKAELLYELLTNEELSHLDVVQNTWILCPTARLADLRIRHGLNIPCEMREVKNKHGRSAHIGFWSIPNDEKAKAIEVYAEINGETK